MHSSTRSGWLRRSALVALLLATLPLSLLAQVRRPDPVPSRSRSASSAPTQRTEILIGGGFVNLDQANATQGMLPVGSIGVRRQFAPEWLHLGAVVDVGRTTIDGEFFPYEKRPIGDTLQYVAVDGSAMMVAGRATVDAMWALDEAERFRAGFGGNAGVYTMLPTPAAGAGAGSFVAPTFGASFAGHAEITKRIGIAGSIGFTQFLGFDREKLRPSDPMLSDAVFVTPLIAPPAAVKSFGGTRVIISLSYRLGVKKTTGGRK